MSEMEMRDDVETEEFTDELSDEALDREQGGRRASSWGARTMSWATDR